MMEIVVNGAPRSIPPGTSVLALLSIIGLKPGRVAVEVNGLVVPAAAHATAIIEQSSIIEIVTLVGGG